MKKYISIEALHEMAEQYIQFSCRPQSCKYKAGTIFDEDKSVKWNKEELERLNKIHDDEVKELNRQKNMLYINLRNTIRAYIIQEINIDEKKADKIFNYLYGKYCSDGFREVLNQLDDLLDLFLEFREV